MMPICRCVDFKQLYKDLRPQIDREERQLLDLAFVLFSARSYPDSDLADPHDFLPTRIFSLMSDELFKVAISAVAYRYNKMHLAKF